ncbi:Putative nuclease [Frankliniella fusca]|uniref:Nuclease n=1 Tax=Frankliniella fusca TaxID=407009 RepID=A0AAE1GWX8_9NEOP|nr:Putative nuclease [Frankliniella fusca]
METRMKGLPFSRGKERRSSDIKVKRSLDYFDVGDIDDPQSLPSPVKETPLSKKMRLSFEINEETPVLLAEELDSNEVSGCFQFSPSTVSRVETSPATKASRVELPSPPSPQFTQAPPPSPVQNRGGEVKKLQADLEEARRIITVLYQKICIAEDVQAQLKSDLEAEKSRLLYKCISESDSKICQYTGLPNKETFKWLLNCFPQPLNYYHGNKSVICLCKENQLLLTLMKLRYGFTHSVLADWFKVSETTVTNVFRTWVNALHTVLFKTLMKTVPSRHKNRLSLPECFAPYRNCRMIIDCTEIRVEIPDSMRHKNLVHSSYKGFSTAKSLVGVAPNGTITYVSDLYPGSNSDKTIVGECGLLNIFEPGDLILADKGFLIHDMLPPGVSLNIPPFKRTAQFTAAQVRATSTIATARIHVERANARIKEYQILECIPVNMFHYSTEIFQTCCALTNLKTPLINEVEDEMRLWK